MLAIIRRPTMVIPTRRLKSFWTYKVSWPQDTQAVTMLRFEMESFMNNGSFVLQCGQSSSPAEEGEIASSPSQALHLKCIIGAMKPLMVILLVAGFVQAESVADVARKERERQAQSKPTQVITATEPAVVEPPKPPAPPADAKPADTKAAETPKAEPAKTDASKDASKPQQPAVDPVQLWNAQLEQLRAKVRSFQDQELALQLQQQQATNQVYAPVTDPASQQAALAQLRDIQERLAKVRKDMDDAKKLLDAMQLQGPPKK